MTTNLIEAHSTEISITFKNTLLQDCTNEIKAILDGAVQYANDKNREIAKILGKVKTEKLYEADGFKSVDQYAEKTFGIKKANAYALAAAGEVYNDEKASPELKKFSYSKLNELARVKDRAKVEKAVKDGKITPDTTQQKLREIADELNGVKSGAFIAEVEPTYKIAILNGVSILQSRAGYITDMEEWDKIFGELFKTDEYRSITPMEIAKLPKRGKKEKIIRKLYLNDKHALAVEFYPALKPTPTAEEIALEEKRKAEEALAEQQAAFAEMAAKLEEMQKAAKEAAEKADKAAKEAAEKADKAAKEGKKGTK